MNWRVHSIKIHFENGMRQFEFSIYFIDACIDTMATDIIKKKSHDKEYTLKRARERERSFHTYACMKFD